MKTDDKFSFEISLSVLNHLGRNLYRSFVTVLGEAVSNAWDAKDLAEVEKAHAAIVKIYKEIGASDNDLKALSRKYSLLDEPELGGEGLAKGIASEGEIATAESY